MLDLGFVIPIKRIARELPPSRQRPVLFGYHAEGDRFACGIALEEPCPDFRCANSNYRGAD